MLFDEYKYEDPRIARAEKEIREEMEYDDGISALYSDVELYEIGIKEFLGYGYRVFFDPASQCGLGLEALSEPDPVKGINYPGLDFRVWKPATPKDLSQVQRLILGWKSQKDPAIAALGKFWHPFSSGERKIESRLAITAKRINDMGQATLGSVQPTFNQPNPVDLQRAERDFPVSFVPKKEWFDPQLQNLKLEDILTLLPEAERHIFALAVGRALVGRSGDIHGGQHDPISHTARMCVILCGGAGVGKSSTMSALWSAMSKVGYRVAPFRDLVSRFGRGDIYQADVAYKDDTSVKSLRTMLSDETTKALVTGTSPMEVEEKYSKPREVWPRAVVFANANRIDPRLAWDLDPGIIDRTKILATYEVGNIQKQPRTGVTMDAPDLRPRQYVEWLCEKLDVSPDALMLWVCRLCVDYFYLHMENATLDMEVAKWSLQLHKPLHMSATGQFLSFVIALNALAGDEEAKDFLELPRYEATETDWYKQFLLFKRNINERFDLVSAITKHGIGTTFQLHPANIIRFVDRLRLRDVILTAEARSAGTNPDSDDKIMGIISKLRLRDGLPLSGKMEQFIMAHELLQDHLYTVADIVSEIESSLESTSQPNLELGVGTDDPNPAIADNEITQLTESAHEPTTPPTPIQPTQPPQPPQPTQPITPTTPTTPANKADNCDNPGGGITNDGLPKPGDRIPGPTIQPAGFRSATERRGVSQKNLAPRPITWDREQAYAQFELDAERLEAERNARP